MVERVRSEDDDLRVVQKRSRQLRPPGEPSPATASLAQALSASLIGYVVGGFFLSLAYRDMLLVLLALVAALRKVTLLAERPPTLARHPLTWSS